MPFFHRCCLLSPLLALAACGAAHRQVSPAEAMAAAYGWPAAVDWQAAGDEAVELLSGYLQTPTPNPPGNETLGARYLGAILAREGIDYQIHEYTPGRGSLVARLSSSGEESPLCLLSHIDVATVDPAEWTHPEDVFSGAVRDGYVWGRGALDMKSLGIMELAVFLWLHRLGVPLRRDVVFLAVADEEVDNNGALYLGREHWDEIGCSHLINEGGLGVVDPIFADQTVYTISVGEKGTLWLEMTAHAESGHGSVDWPGESVDILLAAIDRLRQREPEPQIPEVLFDLFYEVGAHGGGLTGWVMRNPSLLASLGIGQLMAHPALQAGITNTIHLTGLRSPEVEPNVVPAEASAILDCRILPGVDPQEVLAEARGLVGADLAVTFEIILEQAGNQSPVDDPLYEALVRHALAGKPNAVAGPVVSVGTTDSIFLRPLGVRAYGFAPIAVPEEHAELMHGADERISVENVREGVRVLFGAVVEVTGDGTPYKGGAASRPPVLAPVAPVTEPLPVEVGPSPDAVAGSREPTPAPEAEAPQ